MKVLIDAIVIPKVEDLKQIQTVSKKLKDTNIEIWAMIETPKGVLNVEAICQSSDRLHVLVMGTSDLGKDLRVPHTEDRIGFQYMLSKCVLAARAYGKDIIDGVCLDLEKTKIFLDACEQGRDLGFDGKSLIHPKQIQAANRVYAPSHGAVADALEIIEAWNSTKKKYGGVVVVNGKLVESLHVEEAQRILALHKTIVDKKDKADEKVVTRKKDKVTKTKKVNVS